ncbi:Hypothetical predicted protein [Mytilus galloprovincialis]|uniref:Uncharacterized protein n=1 Tax=Mytilus galloprovincialis TaxID=29158 RepID=A0A8B6GE46_MYTGA|nr:Hypothetical predicted protein [Mytilus galloprovincialis]
MFTRSFSTTGTVNASDFDDSDDIQNAVRSIFERQDLQPFFKQLVKVGVSEALQEHDAIVRQLQNVILDKNHQIRELQLQKAILEDKLEIVTSNIEGRDEIQSEITRLNEEIEKLKKELISLNEDLEKEKRSTEEKDIKIALLEKEKIFSEEKDARIAQLQRENDAKMAQLAREKDAMIAQLEKEKKSSEEKNARITQLKKEKNAEVAQLKKEHDAIMAELNKEKDAKVELKKKINNLKAEKQQAVCQKNNAVHVLTDLKKGRDGNK